MTEISKLAKEAGYSSYCAYPKNVQNKKKNKNDIIIIGKNYLRLAKMLSYRTGYCGCFAVIPTLFFLVKLSVLNPAIIHIHNLHNSYINLPLLFRFIRKKNIDIVWTFHDCWPITGHCPHFLMTKCDKWKTGCHECPSYKEYPSSIVDNSECMWKLKKKWFLGVENMTIVAPSQWLANLVKQSFLKDYPIKVINNGIDLSVFQPTCSNFRKEYSIPDEKYIVLGVAFEWGVRKGLDVFVELAGRLDVERFQIVLVGADNKTDEQLPSCVISIHRTQNQQELAKIYSAADVFINPTREEVFGLVNVEALACGTPGITFDVGGSSECYDKTCGVVVSLNDVDAMEQEIIRICETHPFSKEDCCLHAKTFDMSNNYGEYIHVYDDLLSNKY